MADKYQRRINRWVRQQNRSLASDAFLGTGRFSIHQVKKVDRDWDVQYLFELKDNKTQEIVFVVANNWNYSRNLFWGINDFIIDIRKKEGW
jgi:hypothetical protein